MTNGELSGLSRVLLPVRMTHQMCPDSHLVVYFKFKDEIVTASKHFMMDDCFVNKVSFAMLYFFLASHYIPLVAGKAERTWC